MTSRAAWRRALLAFALVAAPVLTAWAGGSGRDAASPSVAALLAPDSGVSLPPVDGRFSYQIGGTYAAPPGVSIVDRDHTAAPDPTIFSICYVNAYQAQAEAVGWWTSHHPDLLLRDARRELVIDRDWDEPLLDISTAARRAAVLGVVGAWMDACAHRGYCAVEADNLDSYSRSRGLLTAEDALAYGRLLADRAHHDKLSLGQKNAVELSVRAHRSGFAFAVAEECQVYAECDAYSDVYGRAVIEIEYTDQPIADFVTACRLRGKTASVVLRDRQVSTPDDSAYVERWCP